MMSSALSKVSVNIMITVSKPPTGILYALQSGSGNDYDVLQKSRTSGADLNFEMKAELRYADFDSFDFFGPSIQGPKGGRFIYINIGNSAGDHSSPWNRRIKVPL